MSLFDTFLAQTQLELLFTRRLIADLQSGELAPTLGMTREQAIALLADGAAQKSEMIERLAPLCTSDDSFRPQQVRGKKAGVLRRPRGDEPGTETGKAG